MHRYYSALLALVAAVAVSAGAIAQETDGPAAVRSFDFTYTFAVKDIPEGASSVFAWVPLPPSNAWQDIHDWTVEGDVPFDEVREDTFGNSFARFDLSEVEPAADGSRGASITFSVTRRSLNPISAPLSTTPPGQAELASFLAPDAMIPLDGPIATEAQQTTALADTPVQKAQAIYNHLIDTMTYDKPADKTGWGNGDALWACDARYGNCTDFHSLFIGQARSVQIPSRFLMGFSVPTGHEGTVGGYHCWAEFWDDAHGWVPIDASEANKDKARRGELFGGLDANRVEFVMGRDIELPGAQAGPVNFIIYPYVEVDGAKHTALDKSFSFHEAH